MGLHDNYYGTNAAPATRKERDWQIIGEAMEKCAAEVGAIVDEYHRQWIEKYPEEPMQADGYEVVASAPRVRPARNFRDQAGVDDAE
jgi:hypothetical protein